MAYQQTISSWLTSVRLTLFGSKSGILALFPADEREKCLKERKETVGRGANRVQATISPTIYIAESAGTARTLREYLVGCTA